MALNKRQILDSLDRPTVEVEVPEWGGSVLIRPLMMADLMRFQAGRKGSTDAEASAWLVAMSIVDEEGAPVFSEADVEALAAKSAATVNRLSKFVLKLNRLNGSDDEARVKNS